MIHYGTNAYWRATISLSIASFFVFAMVYLVQPLLPLLAKEFTISETHSSMALSVVVFSISIALLIFGPISDALGRKPIMVYSMFGAAVCTLISPLATDFNSLLGLRALQGIFLGGIPSLAMAYMSDEFSPKALGISIAMYISANTLGGMSGRLLGGFLADLWGWRATFYVVGGLSMLVCVLFSLLLPSPKYFQRSPLRLRSAVSSLSFHLMDRSMRYAFLIGGLHFFVFIGGFNFLTFRLNAAPYHLSASFISLLFLSYLGGTVSSTLSGHFSVRYGKSLAMLTGIAVFGVGIVLTLYHTLWMIMIGLVLQCMGFFFAHSASAGWVSEYATKAKASASGLYLSSYYLGASLGSLYLGVFWRYLHWPGVVLGSVLILCITTWCAIKLRKKELQQSGYQRESYSN